MNGLYVLKKAIGVILGLMWVGVLVSSLFIDVRYLITFSTVCLLGCVGILIDVHLDDRLAHIEREIKTLKRYHEDQKL